MAFLRWIYDALAVVGTAVLAVAGGLLIVAAASNVYQTLKLLPARSAGRAAAPAASTSAVASSAAPTPAAPATPARALPVGREESRARGIQLPAGRSLLINPFGTPQLRTRNAWVERHGRRDFLLVTRDAYFIRGGRATHRFALRLATGAEVPFERHVLSDGSEVAYARFCTEPPDSLLAISVPVESLVPAGMTPCQS